MYSGVSAQSSDLSFSGVVSLVWRVLLYHRHEELLLLDTFFPILKLPGTQRPCFILLTSFVLWPRSLRLDLIYSLQKWGILTCLTGVTLELICMLPSTVSKPVFPSHVSSHFSNPCLGHRENWILSICGWEIWESEKLQGMWMIQWVAEFRVFNYKDGSLRKDGWRQHTLSSIYNDQNNTELWLLAVMCWIVSPRPIPQKWWSPNPSPCESDLIWTFVDDEIKRKLSG